MCFFLMIPVPPRSTLTDTLYPSTPHFRSVAQHNKKLHLAAKMLLAPGQKVPDIGSGWGGLGLYLAKLAGVDVTGVTLSVHQQEVSQPLAVDSGKIGRANVRTPVPNTALVCRLLLEKQNTNDNHPKLN